MNLWLQLGLGGGALGLVWVFIVKLFAYLKMRNEIEKNSTKKTNDTTMASINKLCDKLDKLVESFYGLNENINKMTIISSKNQEIIKDTTDMQFSLLKEINEKVERIDIRTAMLMKEGAKQ